jgi:hypothetical protein
MIGLTSSRQGAELKRREAHLHKRSEMPVPPKGGADPMVRPLNYRALTLMMDWPLGSTR